MVSDRMVAWNGNRMIHEAVRNDNRHHVRRTGYYCKQRDFYRSFLMR